MQGTYAVPPHVMRWVKHQVISNDVIKEVVIDTDMRNAYFRLENNVRCIETFESISLYPFNQSQDWDAMYVLQTR